MSTLEDLTAQFSDRLDGDPVLAQYRSQLLYEMDASNIRYLQWLLNSSTADIIKLVGTPLPPIEEL